MWTFCRAVFFPIQWVDDLRVRSEFIILCRALLCNCVLPFSSLDYEAGGIWYQNYGKLVGCFVRVGSCAMVWCSVPYKHKNLPTLSLWSSFCVCVCVCVIACNLGVIPQCRNSTNLGECSLIDTEMNLITTIVNELENWVNGTDVWSMSHKETNSPAIAVDARVRWAFCYSTSTGGATTLQSRLKNI